MHTLNAALKIGGSLMDSDAQQKKQDAEYDQLRWGIEGRNVAALGKRKAAEAHYKEAAWRELDTATRAYLKTDIEFGQEVRKASLATQNNLVKLIANSGKGAAKGLGGSTGARLDMQADKNWGRNDAMIRHGIREKALAAEFNKKSAQSRASKEIKIAGRKLGVDRSTIFEGIPEGPEQPNQLPELAMNVGQGLFDLWASKSGPSPFTSLPKTGGLT